MRAKDGIKKQIYFEQSMEVMKCKSEGYNSGSNFSWSTDWGWPIGGGYECKRNFSGGQGSSDSNGARSSEQCMVDINGDGRVDAVRMVKKRNFSYA